MLEPIELSNRNHANKAESNTSFQSVDKNEISFPSKISELYQTPIQELRQLSSTMQEMKSQMRVV